MGQRRAWLWIGGVFVLVVGLCLVFFWALRAGRPQVLTLPDKQTVKFLGVTYGTQHRYIHAAPLLRPIAPILPDKLRKRWGIHTVQHRTPQPAVVLWCFWDTPPGTLNTTKHASVFDEDGTETEPESWKAAAYPTGFKMIAGWEFYHFPRRSKTIGFRIYQRAKSYKPVPVGQFQVSNPGRGRHPQWSASPLPMTVKEGDLAFSMTEFTVGQRIPERFQQVRGWIAPWASTAFEVRRAGELDLRWRIESITVTDATGNTFSPPPHTFAFTNTGSVLQFGFPGAFWKSEATWKVIPEFSRIGGFASNELHQVTLPFPAVNLTNRLPMQVMFGTSTVAAELIRTRTASLKIPVFRMWNADLRLTIGNPPAGTRLVLAEIVDDQGRRCDQHRIQVGSGGYYHYQLDVPRDAQTLHLALALSRSQFVGFTARPDRAADSPGTPAQKINAR